MTQDAEVVQPDVVPEGTIPPEPEVQPEPLTEAKIREIITDATKEAKREIQSVKDKARAEVEAAQGRAGLAEDTLAGLEKEGIVDSETTELNRLRARDKHYQTREAQAYQRQQMEVFAKNFRANMNQFITEMGVDPDDKRIDWGDDVRDYLSKQQRILASVGKIGKETKEGFEKRVKQEAEDKVARDRKEAGIDSVDTSASLGAGGSDAEFQRKFGAGELPYSKENVERSKKIMNK